MLLFVFRLAALFVCMLEGKLGGNMIQFNQCLTLLDKSDIFVDFPGSISSTGACAWRLPELSQLYLYINTTVPWVISVINPAFAKYCKTGDTTRHNILAYFPHVIVFLVGIFFWFYG